MGFIFIAYCTRVLSWPLWMVVKCLSTPSDCYMLIADCSRRRWVQTQPLTYIQCGKELGCSCYSLFLSCLYSFHSEILHYRIKYKNNEYTIDDEDTFENLTQMVEHYQQDADGLATQLKIPMVNMSGKVEYSVDAEDFKRSKSDSWRSDRCLHGQAHLGSGELCYVGRWDNCRGWVGKGMLNIDISRVLSG